MDNLKHRTKKFALDVVRYCCKLPPKPEHGIIARQLMRAATSVGANYRAACRAKSKRDFICKLSVVEEEADECAFWLELLSDLQSQPSVETKTLLSEAGQLVAIMVSSKKTARGNS